MSSGDDYVLFVVGFGNPKTSYRHEAEGRHVRSLTFDSAGQGKSIRSCYAPFFVLKHDMDDDF